MNESGAAFQIQESAVRLPVTLDKGDSAELTRVGIDLDLSVTWMVWRLT